MTQRLSLTPAATEPIHVTLRRTVPMALIIASIVTVVVRGVPLHPAEWLAWLARAAAALWITWGGHYVERFYLLRVLPAVAVDNEPRSPARWLLRLAARSAVWALGGAALGIGAMTTYRLMLDHAWPNPVALPQYATLGALGLVLIELFGVHLFFAALGRPSAWARREGRWG